MVNNKQGNKTCQELRMKSDIVLHTVYFPQVTE